MFITNVALPKSLLKQCSYGTSTPSPGKTNSNNSTVTAFINDNQPKEFISKGNEVRANKVSPPVRRRTFQQFVCPIRNKIVIFKQIFKLLNCTSGQRCRTSSVARYVIIVIVIRLHDVISELHKAWHVKCPLLTGSNKISNVMV